MTSTQYKAIANSSPIARQNRKAARTLSEKLDVLAFALFAAYMAVIIILFA